MPEKIEILSLKREDFASITQEVLGRGRALRFRAKGGSMSPFIRNGDIVEVIPVKGKINLGDVVFYRSSHGRMVIHRVIQRRKRSIITKGDALFGHDGSISLEQILGRVAVVDKRGARITLDCRSGKLLSALFFIISIPPFIYLSYSAVNILRLSKKILVLTRSSLL